MGDAADDVYDAEELILREHQMMLQDVGARWCPRCSYSELIGDTECPVCHDPGYIDKDGKPVDF